MVRGSVGCMTCGSPLNGDVLEVRPSPLIRHFEEGARTDMAMTLSPRTLPGRKDVACNVSLRVARWR